MKTFIQITLGFVVGFVFYVMTSDATFADLYRKSGLPGLLGQEQTHAPKPAAAGQWYFVIEFKPTGRTLKMAGPFNSGGECETSPGVVKIKEAAQNSGSTLKCIYGIPDLQ